MRRPRPGVEDPRDGRLPHTGHLSHIGGGPSLSGPQDRCRSRELNITGDHRPHVTFLNEKALRRADQANDTDDAPRGACRQQDVRLARSTASAIACIPLSLGCR
jgi:beta-lactamase class A